MGAPDRHGAEQSLLELDRLRRRVRVRVHAGAWFPAAAIAALLLASIALYRYPFTIPPEVNNVHPFWAGLDDLEHNRTVSYAFWFTGAPAVTMAIGLWYRWRARRAGVQVAWPLVVGTTLGMLALVAVLAAVPESRTARELEGIAGDPDKVIFWDGLLTPLLPVCAAVLVLGLVERSRALVAAGAWVTLLTWWQCTMSLGIGRIPGVGDQDALRPGPILLLMAVPLVVFAVANARRSRRAAG